MNSEVKEKWLTSLRSGEYKQAKRTLRRDTGFCCLGVLCDLYGKEKEEDYWTKDANGNYNFVVGSKKAMNYLHPEVMKWAGLSASSPVVDLEEQKPILSFKNDSGATFEQIADIIEAGL